MKFLVTGGAGFLGSNISEEILKRGGDLCVVDNLSRVGSEQNLKWLEGLGKFLFEKKDVRFQNDMESVFSSFQPDVVFHFSGQVAMTSSIANPRNDFEINALGTFNVLESVRKFVPKSPVFFSSTNKVYGDLEYLDYSESATRYETPKFPKGFDETLNLDFRSPYGCSKGTADQYMLDYHRIFGLKTVVFRHSSIFGGRQFATVDQGWVGWFAKKAIEAKRNPAAESFSISGNGRQVRDILFAADLIQCYFKALEKIDQIQGQAYNIGGGMKESFSLLELFDFLQKQLDVKLKYHQLPARISDQKVFVADTGKAWKDFGWKPLVSKEQAVSQMLDWVSSHD